MKKLIGLFAIISMTSFARQLTLESAIDLGLRNSKTIRTSELSNINAQLNLNKAVKRALPRVVYNGQYQKAEHSKRIMLDVPEAKSGYSQTIGIYQPIFTGGSIAGGIISAKASKEIASLSYLAEKRDVRLEIIKLYSQAINYEKNIGVLELSLKELNERYRKQQEQLNMRMITKADILKTEYSILELESQITGEKTNLEIAKKDLKLKLKIPKNEELLLVDFQVPNDLVNRVNFDKDLDQALSNSIASKIAEKQVDYAKGEKMASKSEFLPQIEAFATYGNSRETHHYDNNFDDAEWRGGVSVKWNVFEFGSGIDNYRAASNTQEIEELNKELTKDNIKLNVTRNYRELIRLQQLKVSKERAYQAAKENFSIDTERYNAGLISTIDFLMSESQYRDSAVSLNRAILDYYIAFETYRSALI